MGARESRRRSHSPMDPTRTGSPLGCRDLRHEGAWEERGFSRQRFCWEPAQRYWTQVCHLLCLRTQSSALTQRSLPTSREEAPLAACADEGTSCQPAASPLWWLPSGRWNSTTQEERDQPKFCLHRFSVLRRGNRLLSSAQP